jgi:O-antigen/teichoic acid export membrane protein
MNKYKTLVSNTALISAGTVGSKVLVFLMVRFYTGYLSPADYGTADLITQTANLLIPVFSLGITDGVFRFAIDRKGARDSVFTTGFYAVAAGCAALCALVPALNRIPAIRGCGWLVAAFVSASCLHALCAQFIRAEGNTALYAGQGLVNTALVIGLNILFLAVFRLGITGYVLSVAAANLLCTVYLIWREKLWRRLVLHPRRALAREMLRYSIPLIPTTVFWWITSVSDRYMVTASLGSRANGLYSVAYKIPTVVTILSSVFLDAWQLSAVTEAQGDRDAHTRFYSQVWRAFFPAIFLCGAGIIALSRPAIGLLAAGSYAEAWVYIPLLALAMVFASFSSFLGSVYVVAQKSVLSFRTAMVGAVLNIVLNLVLIPSPLGVQGAAVATFSSYFVVFLIRAVSARRLIPFRLFARSVVAGSLILAAQTAFIVFQLPLWQLAQISAIAFALFLCRRPLLLGLSKLGPAGFSRLPTIFRTSKGEFHDTDSD